MTGAHTASTVPAQTRDVVGAVGAEFLGALLLVLIPTSVATAAASGAPIAGPGLDSLSVALTIASVALGKQSALDSSLTIGAALAIIVAFGGPLTGGAFNPARALGPMLTSGQWDAWYLYVPAELLGGYAGMAFYLRFLRSVNKPA